MPSENSQVLQLTEGRVKIYFATRKDTMGSTQH